MRPRGFADWKPKQAGLDMVAAVTYVLEEYADFLPKSRRFPTHSPCPIP